MQRTIQFPREFSASQLPRPESTPVFGLILLGGAVSGAAVRDIRLANELADRGYPVHVWWAVERMQSPALRPSIQQHWLFHGFRYVGKHTRSITDGFGRLVATIFPDANRAHFAQRRQILLHGMWRGLLQQVCDGVEHDRWLIAKFARQLAKARVTHMLPSLEVLCPFAAAARTRLPHKMKFTMTFQGYEIYVKYAREIGSEKPFYRRIREMVAQADWPSIAVSDDYAQRIVEEIGIARDRLAVIPPGVPVSQPLDRAEARRVVAKNFKEYRGDLPLVSFIGRRDTEKGIDLLLYAVNMLRQRGEKLQLFVCGSSAFGQDYGRVCSQLAEDLRTTVVWKKWVPDEIRSALFAASRCVVYPSVHREPFGMVPVEAMAHGTPAIVPNWGGVASVISVNGRQGGLQFNAWDSADLADKIATLLHDDQLHRQLSAAGPAIAEHFSVANLGNRMLAHLGVEARPHVSGDYAAHTAISPRRVQAA